MLWLIWSEVTDFVKILPAVLIGSLIYTNNRFWGHEAKRLLEIFAIETFACGDADSIKIAPEEIWKLSQFLYKKKFI